MESGRAFGFLPLLFFLGLLFLPAGEALGERNGESKADIEAGHGLYEKWCAHCHGTEGKGDGTAAPFLYPRPRDFSEGQFKIRTTPSGELPTDDDIERVILKGMPGTSMPGWEGLLTSKEVKQVVAYMKTLMAEWVFEEEPPAPIKLGEPIPPSPESIARGRELYRKLKCWECHGEEGRGDGPSAPTLEDDWGYSIRAADLTKRWNFRGGDSAADIYRTFSTGMNGTPMPSYADTLGEEDRWHLANYVRSLSGGRPSVRAVLISRRVKGKVPTSPDDPKWQEAEWQFYPLVGQIVREPRLFTPSIDSIYIKSLYSDEEIGFLLTWNDPTKSEDGTPDMVALQFPPKTEGQRPYFLMGERANPVNLWRWKAGGNTFEEISGHGVERLLPQAKESQRLSGEALYEHGRWVIAIKRPLTTDDKEEVQFEPGRFIPLAFFAWNGGNEEEGAKMAMSSWYYLRLEKSASWKPYLFTPIAVFAAIGIELLIQRSVRKKV